MANEFEILIDAEALLPHFAAINREWINEMFVLEETDRAVLDNARELILDRGGRILFARHPELGVVGTCALLKTSDGEYELTKMGVSSTARGLKAGETLLLAAIELAMEMGAGNLYLLTNHICEAAIHLYEKQGFRHDAEIMERFGARYRRCDVAMRYYP